MHLKSKAETTLDNQIQLYIKNIKLNKILFNIIIIIRYYKKVSSADQAYIYFTIYKNIVHTKRLPELSLNTNCICSYRKMGRLYINQIYICVYLIHKK